MATLGDALSVGLFGMLHTNGEGAAVLGGESSVGTAGWVVLEAGEWETVEAILDSLTWTTTEAETAVTMSTVEGVEGWFAGAGWFVAGWFSAGITWTMTETA